MSFDFASPIPNDPEEIAKKLVDAEATLKEVTFELEDTEDQIDPYEEEIRKMQAKIAAMRSEQQALKSKVSSLKYNKSLLQSKVTDLKNALYAAESEKLKQQEMDRRSAEIDELARMFPWFGPIKRHQFEAAKQIAVMGGRVVLGDKRGLGKSLTALAAADLLKAKKIVVISKGEILRNFEKEVQKWRPNPNCPMLSIVSQPKHYRDMVVDTVFPMVDEFMLLVNFEAWWRDKTLVQRIAKLQPDTVIIDEAHHAKETDKNNFRGLDTLVYNKNKCPECGHNEIAFHNPPREFQCKKCYHVNIDERFMSVKHVIPMTGSPIMNRPEEFFPLLYLIDKKQFRSKDEFLHGYCRLEDYTNLMGRTSTRWGFRPGGSAQLLEAVGPRFIQRDRKSAGVEIPDQEIQYHVLEFDKKKYPRQWRAYRDLIEYTGALFDSENKGRIVATQASSLITRMRQVASWPRGIKIYEPDPETGEKRLVWQCDIDESIKVDHTVDLVAELVGEGERVVIFSKFTAVLEELKRRFDATLKSDEKIRAAIYYGGTPVNERERIKNDFDISTYDPDNYAYDVVLCQYQAAGEGLNFNSATQMVFVEREWNPEKEGQATGRIQRLGQNRKSTVHVLELEDTIDTDIKRLLGDKQELIGDFESNADLMRQILEEARKLK